MPVNLTNSTNDMAPAKLGTGSIAIIGAGLAGLSCARVLATFGRHSVIFEKSRGFGGRVATRRTETPLGPVTFDHGAQYFTVRDEGFRALTREWEAKGVAARWEEGGEDAFVGVPTMNSPFRDLGEGLEGNVEVRRETLVTSLKRDADEWVLGVGEGEVKFGTVVVAIPAEQAAVLLRDAASDFAAIADNIPSTPCWTVMAAFSERVNTKDVVNRQGKVDYATRQGSRPGRAAGPEAWVIHAEGEWSRARIEGDPKEMTGKVLTLFAEAVGTTLPETVWARAHRWRYSRSGRGGREFLWDGERRIGVCGDWMSGPRVEAAFLSGDALGRIINS